MTIWSRWTAPLSLGLVLSFLAGCDLYDTPERYVDDTARPPVVMAVQFSDLQRNQSIAGLLQIEADFDSLRGRIDYTSLFVNTQEVQSVSGTTRPLFDLDTRQYDEGLATLALGIYLLESRSSGLLNGAPDYVLVATVVFDQSPPTPVTDVTAAWEDAGVTLTWTPNRDENFAAYVISRSDTWSGKTDSYTGRVVLDTLYNAAAATYRDPAATAALGLTSTYYVDVTNRAETTGSPGVTATYGTPQNIDPAVFQKLEAGGPIRFRGPGDVVFFGFEDLNAFTPSTGAVTTVSHASRFVHPNNTIGTLAADRWDGTELFVMGSDGAGGVDTPEALVYSATPDLSFQRRLALPDGIRWIRRGPAGRLLGSTDTDEWHLLDVEDGRSRATITLPAFPFHMEMITPTTLLVGSTLSSGACALDTYNVSDDAARHLGRVEYGLLPHNGCGELTSTPDGSSAFLFDRIAQSVQVLDVAAMTLEDPVSIEATGLDTANPSQFKATNDRLYVGYAVPDNGPAARRGAVLALNGSTLAVERTWDFARPVHSFFVTSDEASLFVHAGVSYDDPPGALWKLNLLR